jgi:hypothetical protein
VDVFGRLKGLHFRHDQLSFRLGRSRSGHGFLGFAKKLKIPDSQKHDGQSDDRIPFDGLFGVFFSQFTLPRKLFVSLVGAASCRDDRG